MNTHQKMISMASVFLRKVQSSRSVYWFTALYLLIISFFVIFEPLNTMIDSVRCLWVL